MADHPPRGEAAVPPVPSLAKPSELARFVVDVSKFKLRTTSWGETFLACPLCDEELKAPLDLTLIELTSTARNHLTVCPKGSNHA